MNKPEARPLRDWHEDMGSVLWWRFPICEPPYVGTPLDCGLPIAVKVFTNIAESEMTQCGSIGGWPGYHTHFTLIEPPVQSGAWQAGFLAGSEFLADEDANPFGEGSNEAKDWEAGYRAGAPF